MFFEADRIKAMREMIVSETSEQREKALAKLEPIQQADFEAIYEAMKGRPVTIRLLDPPLHEFVPTDPRGHRRAGQGNGPDRRAPEPGHRQPA